MYSIVYVIFYLVSLLPWRVLYWISDFLFGVVFYLVRYRREVVLANLAIAFPEKTQQELRTISKAFYHNFCDNFVETLKLLSASKQSITKRFEIDFSLIDSILSRGQNVQFHMGHFFNWEMANLSFAQRARLPFLLVYMPLQSAVFERLMRAIRTRFGTVLISANRFNMQYRHYHKQPHILVYVADQNPHRLDQAQWIPFFKKATPFSNSPEKTARYNNSAVIFSNFYSTKRGYYRAAFELVTTTPGATEAGFITKALSSFLETCLKQRPANYLWTHRRWKFAKDE